VGFDFSAGFGAGACASSTVDPMAMSAAAEILVSLLIAVWLLGCGVIFHNRGALVQFHRSNATALRKEAGSHGAG
jgi:hypothetical protein